MYDIGTLQELYHLLAFNYTYTSMQKRGVRSFGQCAQAQDSECNHLIHAKQSTKNIDNTLHPNLRLYSNNNSKVLH